MSADSINDKVSEMKDLAESIEMLLQGLQEISEGKKGESNRIIKALDRKVDQLAESIKYLKSIENRSFEETRLLESFNSYYDQILKKYSQVNLALADKIRELKNKTILQKKRIDIRKSYGV